MESAPNDVVVINLGTNDSSYIKGDTERSETYAEQYAEFLKTVRSCNPDAYIICTLGTMGGEELYPYIQKAIEQFQSETGDERITSYLSTVQDFNADGVGSDWHPSAKTQQKSAYVLADQESVRHSALSPTRSVWTRGKCGIQHKYRQGIGCKCRNLLLRL